LLICSCNLPAIADGESKQQRPRLEEYLQQLGYYAVPLRRDDQNKLVARGIWGGKERKVLVDTGCSVTRVGQREARKLKKLSDLGAHLKDSALGTITNTKGILLYDLELGHAKFTNQPAWPAQLSSGVPGLILGLDFFIRNHCLIDCLNCRLYVRAVPLSTNAQAALRESLQRSGFHAVQFSDDPEPFATFDAEANGKKVRLLVDTGAVYSMFDDDVAKRLGLLITRTPLQARGVGKVGSHPFDLSVLKSFKVGDVEAKNTLIGVVPLEHWGLAEKTESLKEVDGLLGADWLGVNEAVIDFRGNRFWFRPPKKK